MVFVVSQENPIVSTCIIISSALLTVVTMYIIIRTLYVLTVQCHAFLVYMYMYIHVHIILRTRVADSLTSVVVVGPWCSTSRPDPFHESPSQQFYWRTEGGSRLRERGGPGWS